MGEDFPAQLAWFRQGSQLAGYRLEAQAGVGGMAVVFRARDERLGRLVALKILAPALTADSGFRRRFIAESRAAAAVEDPNIIPVYEAGEADGVLFIAMRFVRGGDMRRVLEREGVLPPGRAVEFISPVASALDAAHAAGLVHRDIKPANILVDVRPARPDHVYLSDFGVSKGAISSVSLTGTGQFLGTPDYSPPEQIEGRAVDGRTDQYALACVAYQLLTGAVPFERDQGMAVLLAHLSAPPPSLDSRRPGLPAAADQVLARGMAKVPEKRYESCGDFADALREAVGLAPYISRGSASAPGHPHAEITSQPRFSGSAAAAAAAGTGKAAVPADPAAAATVDSAPARSPGAADLSAAAAIVTRPAHPGTPTEAVPPMMPDAVKKVDTPGAAAAASAADVRAVGQPARHEAWVATTPSRQSEHVKRRWSRPHLVIVSVISAVAVLTAIILGVALQGNRSFTPGAEGNNQRAESSSVPMALEALQAGDCILNTGTPFSGSGLWVESVQELPCNQNHAAEVLFAGDLWTLTDTYPGQSAVDTSVENFCENEFSSYVGITPKNSKYKVEYEDPSQDSWIAGDRAVLCFAYSQSGNLSGTVRNSGQ